ncbi:MAG: FAD-binding protein [Bacteroidia bacterium]
MKIKNWGRNLVFKPDQIIYPKTEQEIIQLVKKAGAANKKIRVIGTGHSWTPLVTTDDILVSMNNYQGIIEVDSISQTALVKAGTKLKLLGELLFKERLAMENLGDIDEQSIAGAISTGTHGTGIIFGTISTQIIEMSFINGKEKNYLFAQKQPRDFPRRPNQSGSFGNYYRNTPSPRSGL